MVDSSKITPFPVFLIQDLINIGIPETWNRKILYGDKYINTLNSLIVTQGKTTDDCYDKIFKVPDSQMVEMPENFFDGSFTL